MIASMMQDAGAIIEDRPRHEQETRLDVIQEALTWLGTPYHHQGRIRGCGVDCGMLLLEVYQAVGVLPHVEIADYPHDWHLHRDGEIYLGHVRDHCDQVGRPLPGDLALFKFGRCLSHGGIMLDDKRMIHSYFGRGVVIDDLDTSELLGKRLAGFWSPWRS